mmetsp:Transcript_9052/g.20443  ORF Transcript_9052/g.20443 Transcript_9052/m.20443 type:complete len:490 (-) Transcript_9052:53-1522(-)|eukprot:CAMPEP_0172316886 /NCGR_PEP_ID=MMETSP1058-20130122/29866_1 /TAXON_ID=83371 /ORGANISM="Detonula confervacea, Strain CCMP 353" /LENGTH=489 /DNA_ID=CAMNT_0013031319 /DNA_START=268 /DNA_END=1737 /DNA_ORIENTATION=+
MTLPPPTTLSSIYTKGLPVLTPTTLNPHAPLGKWLLSTSSLVFAMVHIGGVTRLTKSGLSMTEWKPLGSRPPMSEEEWEVEFERYKLHPEWEQRKSMGLEEFKYIYYWEWGHRMMGRFVGVVFGGGWLYFTWIHQPKMPSLSSSSMTSILPKNITSAIPPGYQSRLALLFAMGGTQGLVGWWMVKSGLGDDRRGDRSEIRVSPYRLAAHLGMAVGTYSVLVWTGLGALSYPVDYYAAANASTIAAAVKSATNKAAAAEKSVLSLLQQYTKNLTPTALQHAQKTRLGVLSTVGLTGLTILSGAFVAGNDAGNAYNTYPLMNGQLIPWDDMVDPEKSPKWRNAFETTATVQWNHRMLGTATALSAVGVAGYGLLHPATRASSMKVLSSTTPQVQRGLVALGTAATAQMSLGVATLLNYVPISLAASHQLGSLVVLTCGVYTAHSLRYAGRSVVSKVGSGAAQSLVGGGGGGGIMQKGAAVVSKVANVKIRI